MAVERIVPGVVAGVLTLLLTACGGGSPQTQVTVTASPTESAPSPSPTPTPTPSPSTIQSALEVVRPAVAKVTVSSWGPLEGSWGDQFACNISTGTAFAVTPTLLVTAAHVVEGRDRTRVTWQGATQPGTVVGYDREKDVALIQVPGPVTGTLQWRTTPAQAAEEVATYGYAKGQSGSFFDGHVNRVDAKVQVGDRVLTGLIESDIAFQPGNSGGPVFDKDAKVVGIVEAAAVFGAGNRYAVAASTARPLITTWSAKPEAVDDAKTSCNALPGEVENLSGDGPGPYSRQVNSAAMTLLTYINAINDADFVTAHAQLANGGDLTKFADGVRSSVWSRIQYDAITDGDQPVIDLTFQTTQDVGQGPAPRTDETCTLWHIRYNFVPRNDLWLIGTSTAQPGRPKNEPCGASPSASPEASYGGD